MQLNPHQATLTLSIPTGGELAPSAEASATALAMIDAIETHNASGGIELPVTTHHLFHAGMYHRTIMVRKGTVLVGALLRRATTLIVSGHAELLAETPVLVKGYAVLPGMPGRQTGLATFEDTWFTMIVPTEHTTVEDIDAEMVGDVPLGAHRFDNVVINTGVPR